MTDRASNARANYISAPSSQKDTVARIFRSVFGVKGCRIEEVGRDEFDAEKAMQALVEENMGVVFPGCEFIAHEFPLDGKRIDTVAFDTKSRSFMIIEYKNTSSKEVLEQAGMYLSLLKQRSGDFLAEYHQSTKVLLKRTDVDWDDSRMVVIAPSFTNEQRNLASLLSVPIELHKITKYKNGIMAIECVTNNKPKKVPRPPPPPGGEEEYLTKKSSPATRKLYDELKSALSRCIPNAEIETTQVYIKWVSGGKPVCTVQVAKRSLNLCYTTDSLDFARDDSKFITHLVKDGKSIGKLGLGNYRSKIKDAKDIARAIPYVEAVYKSKAKRYKK